MRIAILSDIHGNSTALDAVLADAVSFGAIDRYWILGDLVAVGPDPIGVLERLNALPNLYCTRGNTDRYLLTGERPPPTFAEVLKNPAQFDVFRQVESSFSWTQGALAASGWLDWLSELPLELHLNLPDGTRLLGVHAAPGQDDGPGLHPHLTQKEIAATLAHCRADLVFVGHTHWACDFHTATARAINLGSVSNPLPPDLRASYVLLEADRSGYHIERRFVDYDHQSAIDACERIKHPATSFIKTLHLGQHAPSWFKKGACAILTHPHDRVALQLRDDKPGLRGADCWGLFGGIVEEGETPEQALLREMQEELNIALDPAGLQKMRVIYAPTAIESHVFHYELREEMDAAILREGQRFAFVGASDLDDGVFDGKQIVPHQLELLQMFWNGE